HLAVGEDLDARIFLPGESFSDRCVLCLSQLLHADPSGVIFVARVLQLLGPDEAADLVASEFSCHFSFPRSGCSHRPSPERQTHSTTRSCAFRSGFCLLLSDLCYPHTFLAVSTMSSSLRFSSSIVIEGPSRLAADWKPHWGPRASWSSGQYFEASSIRLIRSSCFSSLSDFVVIRPSIATLPRGTWRRGSKPPARSVSYSSRKRST